MKRALAILAASIATLLLSGAAARAQMSVAGGWQATQLIRTSVASDGYRTYNYAWGNGAYAGVSSLGSFGVPGLWYSYSIFWNYSTSTEQDMLLIMDDPHYEAAKKGSVITDEHYLSVPAAAGYNIPLASWLSLGFFAGAEVDYCLSSKSYSSWPGIDGVNNWNVDHFGAGTNYNGYRRFDLALLGGANLIFAGRIKLEGGISYGLLDRSEGEGHLHRFAVHAGIAYIFK